MNRAHRAIVALLVACTACSSNATSSSTGSGNELCAATVGEDGVVEVTLWRHLAVNEATAVEGLIDDFNATHPHVRVNVIDKMGGDRLASDLLNAEADERPDMAMVIDAAVRPAIDRNLLVPAQACLDATGTTLGDLLPGALESAATGGVQWGVPFGASGHVLVYNRAAFRAAGLEPDRPPTTLAELTDAARAIVASRTSPTGLVLTELAPLFVAAGVSMDHPNGPAGMAVATWLSQAKAENLAQTPHVQDERVGFVAIGAGEAAMAIESTTALPEIVTALHSGQAPGVELGIAAVPTPNGSGAVPHRTDAIFLVAQGSAERRAASWSFMSWLAEPAQQARLAAKTGFMPVNTKAAELDELKARWRDLPELEAAWSLLASAPSVGDPLAPPAREMREALELSASEIFRRGLPADQLLREAEDRASTAAARYAADPARYAVSAFGPEECLYDVDLYSLTADGAAKVPLTPDEVSEGAPVWSPDGKTIAFASHVDGNTDVYVIDADGSNRRRLTTNPGLDTFPDWSPDGDRIVFVSDRLENLDIYTMAADGSDVRRLTSGTEVDQNPSWSPDGQHIAYVHENAEGGPDVWVMDTSGGDVHPVTSAPEPDLAPDWSPDGTRIAFVSERDGDPALYVMNADGTDPHRVVADRSQVSPAWSPDGTQIAVVNLPFSQIYLAAADGSSYRQLTTTLDYFHWPSWSPDGTHLVVSSRRTPI